MSLTLVSRLSILTKQFLLALDTAPDLRSAKYNLALVLSQRGKNSEALALLEFLTTTNPQDTDFHFARGHCLFQLTRFNFSTTAWSPNWIHMYIYLQLNGGYHMSSFNRISPLFVSQFLSEHVQFCILVLSLAMSFYISIYKSDYTLVLC